jgi:tetratricopeptide (TPR) repeat protein
MAPDGVHLQAPRRRWGIAGLLAAGAAVLYARVAHHPFIYFDDTRYLTENGAVQRGLTWDGVVWAFTTLHASNWHPLTWLSHMLDVQLFGMDAGAHHLVNVLLHAVNAALLFLVLGRMTGAPGRSAVVAALFAVHPLHVESVAWIAERKDLLSTLFGLLALGAYARYVERPGARRYAAVALCLALSLLAKPMWVTLPFLLLVLDAWPLARRVPFGQRALEKVPLLVLSVASSIVTVVAQHGGGAMTGLEVGVGQRIGNALVGYARYLGKTFWPRTLAIYYPYPDHLPLWQPLAAAALLAAVTAVAALRARRWPWLAAGWCWFLGMLVPVIGLVQVGGQAIADRYTYVPIVGIFIAVVWTASHLASARAGAAALRGAGALVLAALCAVTWRQLGLWSDHVTLFEHALAVEPESGIAHGSLSEGLRNAGRLDEARAHAREAVRIAPADPRHWNNLAMLEREARRLDAARDDLRQALRADPRHLSAWSNLGLVEQERGDLDAAAAALHEAARLAPDDAQVHHRLGNVLALRGDVEGAIAEHAEAVRLRPDYASAWNALGILDQATGRGAEAIQAFRAMTRAEPASFAAWRNLGVALAKGGRGAEAGQAYREALRLRPGDPEVTARLAAVEAGLQGPR